METISPSLQSKWDDLVKIFDVQPFVYNRKVERKLEKLGYKTIRVKGNHPKMYINLDKTYVITLCCSPSDTYCGRQILRQIRKIYNNYDRNNNISLKNYLLKEIRENEDIFGKKRGKKGEK